MLDIIGSFVVRAAVVLIILTTMVNLNNSLFRQTERVALNDLVTGAGETISNDLSLAGYGPTTPKLFVKADSIETKFYADLDNNGTADTVRYYLGAGASGSHRILYRTLNSGAAFEIARDVVLLRFFYWDTSAGAVTTADLSSKKVKSMKVSLTIESTHKLTSIYSGSSETIFYQQATWEKFIFPENL